MRPAHGLSYQSLHCPRCDFSREGIHRGQHAHPNRQKIDRIHPGHEEEAVNFIQHQLIGGTHILLDILINEIVSQIKDDQEQQSKDEGRPQDFATGGFAESEFGDGEEGFHGKRLRVVS